MKRENKRKEKKRKGKTQLGKSGERRRGRRVSDLRMNRESLEPTIDVDLVEPDISSGNDGFLEGRERARLFHFFSESPASAACHEFLFLKLHHVFRFHFSLRNLKFISLLISLPISIGLFIADPRFCESRVNFIHYQ